MKNEKGITLVELLAALAIVAVIIAVIMSVLLTGTSSADRTSSKQQLQQEANYIVEVIRAKYLKKDTVEVRIKVDSVNNKLLVDDVVVSEGYEYFIHDLEEEENKNFTDPPVYTNDLSISSYENVKVKIDLKDGDKPIFTVETTFSKLR